MGVGLLPQIRRLIPPIGSIDASSLVRLAGQACAALGTQALKERERWPLWLPVALGIGIAIYFAMPIEPALGWAVISVLVALSCALGVSSGGSAALRAILALVASGSIGFAAAKFRTEIVAAPVLQQRTGPIGIDGRVEQSELHGEGMRVVLSDLRSKWFATGMIPARVRISFRAAAKMPSPGSWLHVKAVLMPPPSPAEPGSYDFGRHAFYNGLGAVGYGFGHAQPISVLSAPTLRERAQARLERLRNAMTARIRAVVAGSSGAIAAALMTGERGGIDPEDESAYRDSGLMHVLSISGLHLALAGGLFFWVLRALLALVPAIALNHPIKKWSAIAALAGATFYLLISGCEAPAVRSYIMLALMFAAIIFDRPAVTMRAVAFAATVLLLLEPESLIEPGFEMSFAAVIGLVAFGERESSNSAEAARSTIWARIWRYLCGIAYASIVAGLATAPFVIFHFDRSAQYGIVSNLLSLPIAGFIIMPSAAAAMVLMPFGLDRFPLLVMGRGVAMMSAVAHWVASLPGAVAVLPTWPLSALLAVVFGGLWLAVWRERWRLLGLIPIGLGLALALSAARPDILVGRDGSTVAWRLPEGRLGIVGISRDQFVAETWLKRDGDDRDLRHARTSDSDGVRCDAFGCIARTANGHLIAVILRGDALMEDCDSATIVVSAVPAHKLCNGAKLVIDRFDLAQSNGYAVWLGPPLRFETVEHYRGRRPWSSQPRSNRTQYRRINPTSFP